MAVISLRAINAPSKIRVYISGVELIGLPQFDLEITTLSFRHSRLVEKVWRPIWKVKSGGMFLKCRANISLVSPGTRFSRWFELGEVYDADVLVGSDLLLS